MASKFWCPDCGSTIVLPDGVARDLDAGDVGCKNSERHENGWIVVMKGVDDGDD